MSNIDETLKERGSNYGEFHDFANLSQALKNKFINTVIHKGQPEKFTPAMHEAIDMILHKLARIGTGNPLYLDSARDIIGYAQLLYDEIEKHEDAIDAQVTRMIKQDGKWIPLV